MKIAKLEYQCNYWCLIGNFYISLGNKISPFPPALPSFARLQRLQHRSFGQIAQWAGPAHPRRLGRFFQDSPEEEGCRQCGGMDRCGHVWQGANWMNGKLRPLFLLLFCEFKNRKFTTNFYCVARGLTRLKPHSPQTPRRNDEKIKIFKEK